MIYLFQAIQSLYTNAVNIIGNDIDSVEAFDNNGNSIILDKQAITAKNNELSVQSLLNECKNKAKSLLATSDWSVLSDVELTNSSDFVTYRTILRGLVFNPVENAVFPNEPQPIWR